MTHQESFGAFASRMLKMTDDIATRRQILAIWAERNRERARSDRIERWVVRTAFTIMGLCISVMMAGAACAAMGWIS